MESYEAYRAQRESLPCPGQLPGRTAPGRTTLLHYSHHRAGAGYEYEFRFPADPAVQMTFSSLFPLAPMLRNSKPGAGLGWTEPRNEEAIGLVDRRRHLPGYIGGVKKRESNMA